MSDEKFTVQEMSHCTDADKWAKWFTETIREEQIKFPTQESCTEYMRTWFANAMMAMHDSTHNKKIQANEALRRKIIELEMALESYCCCSQIGSTGGQCCFCDDLERIRSMDNDEDEE